MLFFSKNTWMYLLIAAVALWLLTLLAPVLSPFVIAAFLAYIGDPIVDWFESKKMKRTVGVSVVFLVMLLISVVLVMVLAPLIESQVRSLIAKIPNLIVSINTQIVPFLESYFDTDIVELNAETLANTAKQHWEKVGGLLGVVVAFLGDSTQVVLALITFFTIVPVVTFYLLRDWDVMVARIRELIPRRFEAPVVRFTSEADAVLAEFLRGQLALMAAQAAYFCGALALVGLDTALLVGLTAGAVSFVPYLGVAIGLGIGALAAYMQFQELMPVLLVLGVFGIGQVLEGVVLQPLLIGDRIGMHPVAVIFSVMAGGQLFGFVGVLIALPVAAVITVLLRHLHELYVMSELYDEAPSVDTVDISEDTEIDSIDEQAETAH